MEISGKYEVRAARNVVWAVLNDPESLKNCIPGARRLTETEPGKFDVVMSVGIGMIRGEFTGTVETLDLNEPESYRLVITGKGPGGWLEGEGTVELSVDEAHPDRTKVAAKGDVTVGGMLARVGQRMLNGAANSLMKQFFANVSKEARKKEG
jgi:carbon monoxide dehydrogenase subunit G